MNQWKKYLIRALFLVMLLTWIPMGASAATVKTNKWYTVKVSGGHSKKLNFMMPTSGYVLVSGCESGELIVGGDGYCWAGDKNQFIKEMFPKGTRLTLVISGSEGQKTTYKVRIKTFKKSSFETEKNNKKLKSDVLKSSKELVGYLGQDDKDWFIFKAPSTGHYTIQAGLLLKGVEKDFKATVYHRKPQSVVVRNQKTELFSGKVKKGEKVYLRIVPKMYSDVLYKVKVSKKK